jgi:DNA-binding winged helix-turn-helix (wHTH) protein
MPTEENIVRFGPFQFDFQRQELTRSDLNLHLSASQLSLLSLFLHHPGELITREQILQHTWFNASSADPEAVINSLRFHLEDPPQQPIYIETVPGLGYRFIAPITLLDAASVPTPPPSPEDLFASGSGPLDSATLLNLQSDPFLRASVPRRLSPVALRYIGRRLVWITLTSLIVVVILYFVGIHLVHHFDAATQP